ncbi:MAG: nucleotide exchange factor GrpE [Nitrososphaerales archaeon]
MGDGPNWRNAGIWRIGRTSVGEDDLSGKESLGDEENLMKAQLAKEKGREAELLNRLKYMQADFENFRKRTEKDMRETEENSSKGLVLRLLSVLDELDLAVKHSKEDAGRAELQEGVEMVQKNLYSALESAGLQKIEPVGQPFDPTRHEAIAKVQGSSAGSDIVVEELRTGYTFRGRVIRPSMVKVELATKEPVEGGKASE